MLDLVVRSLVERHALSALRRRDLRYDEPTPFKTVNHVALALVICTIFVYFVVMILVCAYLSCVMLHAVY